MQAIQVESTMLHMNNPLVQKVYSLTLLHNNYIIHNIGVYVPSTIEDKPIDTYDILFEPPPISTDNADYSTLFDDKVYVSNDDQ